MELAYNLSSLNLKGSTPTCSADIALWNNYLASVITDLDYGYVYYVRPSGFLNQFIYTNAVANTVTLAIEYKLPTGKASISLDITCEGSVVNTLISLDTSTKFTLLKIDVPIDNASISGVSFKLLNTSASNLSIATINITGLSKVTTKSSTDTDEFMKYAIMYGSDANKPKLR